jgi:hypothetical protein
MNKKYQIVNSNFNSKDDCTIFYILYIVLFFVIVFIIYKIIFNFTSPEKFQSINNINTIKSNNVESFDNTVVQETFVKPELPNLPTSEIISELVQKNNELQNISNTIQNKLTQQNQAIYVSQNFNKIDPSSFDDELAYILSNVVDTQYPTMDMSSTRLISTESELSNILSEAKQMVNIYKPGDIVTSNSSFGISKNDICYRANGKSIKPTHDFISKFPNCMVCTVEDANSSLYDSKGWKETRTNIDKVCLYNPASESNSGIPNLKDCQKFCSIPTTTTTVSSKK